jgi:hypothetical protein
MIGLTGLPRSARSRQMLSLVSRSEMIEKAVYLERCSIYPASESCDPYLTVATAHDDI